MAEKLDQNKETPSWQDIAYSNMIQTEALAQIMFEKGLITKEQFDERIEKIHKAFMEYQQSESGQDES